jgi:hypothetical protein
VGKLGNISGKEAAKAFEKAGWMARGQAGSHLIAHKERDLGKPLGPIALRALRWQVALIDPCSRSQRRRVPGITALA